MNRTALIAPVTCTTTACAMPISPSSRLPLLALALVSALLAACAPTTRVTLLPEADGKPSAVTIRSGDNAQVLTHPYQTAETYRPGSTRLGETTAAAVNAGNPQLLALRPPPPEHFTLYFVPGGSTLTPESEALLPRVLARAAERAGGEMVVTGHTDRVGSVSDNDSLSLQRARSIRDLLVARGFKPALIEAVGRGEREPLVPTADEVDEPRNRRADILVR